MTASAAKTYRFVGSHAEEIVPGQFFGPGDLIKLDGDQQKEESVKRLLDEGQLLEIEDRKEEKK